MDQPRWVTRQRAVSRRVVFEGRISRVVDYFGGAAPDGGPQAYLVEQRNHVLRPHFHPVDQFQILLGAPGAYFGRRPIDLPVAHYADARTVYGPLTGGDPPLRYFTLRAETTHATEFMPESRALLPARPGRSLHREIAPAPVDPAAERAGRTTLLADEHDGLEISCLTAGAGASVELPGAGPSGQFLFVLAGELEYGGAGHPAESIGWQPPGGAGWTGRAASAGTRLLVLRFPARTAVGAPPAETGADADRRAARGEKGGNHA
ncbi:hypothetical protein [Kitasatospora sp. NPDC057015]|uniref:hypothetical protein n=1 Tax=Kitasatospora sp. NPDC057015 TaxID=3346001 RepID=UPI003633CCAB